jgi:hypothetical protein
MYESCLRFEAYRAQRTAQGWYDFNLLKSQCAPRDSAVAGIVAANRVLSSYFSALARLADDKYVGADPEISRLAIIAKKAGLSQPGIDAVAGLAKYLTATGTDAYRRAKLTDAIVAENGNVTFITVALRDVMNLDYRRILNIEALAANDFYRASIADGRARDPLAAILVMRDRDERMAELRKRGEVLDAYLRALDTVRNGHQKLYERRTQLRAKDVSAELVRHVEALERIEKQLERAF